MTRNELAQRVRTDLDDLSAGFYTAQDTTDSLQDGYNLVASLSECVENNAVINFTGGLCYYDFPSLIPDFLRIYGIYNNDTNRWMEPIDTIELYKLRDNYELTNGTPWWFQPISHKYTMIFPAPATTTGSMTVLYKAQAPSMTDDTIPAIPQVDHNILEFYSTADLLEQCEEFIKALKYWEIFNKTLEDVKKLMRNRSYPNSIYYFKP